MASASQTLTTVISINAQANGFGQVGSTLTQLGGMIDGISSKLIDFGKESVSVYQGYEKSMKEAEIALSTSHGRGTKELERAMDRLNAKATEWAATTIFHTDDVANAINQAAHAGWNLDEILNGIPAAMELAQAGSLDLSEALTYITKTMKAFDVPYDQLGEFIDMWVYAANTSTGDVKDFGDAMQKLGATMRFTDSKEELFALIGLMHDMGESGSTAATLLRTSMMRIIAPSGVAGKVMEQLGATDEEIREIREDASKLAAINTLESYGFNAFKEDKQAKPIIQIYAELGEVLAEIAGGYENITKNQTTLGILGTIFGQRGITGALDIVTALQNAVTLRDDLYRGMAEGYGEYASGTMMDTLYGRTEIFNSKMERLKQVVGEELSGKVSGVMEGIGGIVDNIAEMDEGKFSALVSGLSVIATAGPGLIMAGGAFRLLGLLLTPGGAIALGLTGLTAAATAIKELQEYDFSQNFGNMDLDTEDLKTYIHTMGEDFRAAYENTDAFAKALETAKTNYESASGTFSSNIFSLMIKNTKLTQEDLDGLLALGDQMYEYVQEAMWSAASGSGEYWTALFGGGDAESINNPAYDRIIELTNQEYLDNMDKLGDIGRKMRKTILDAFTNDNEIDPEEYQKILGVMREYNDMIARATAEAAKEESYIKRGRWLEQAQTASLSDIREIVRSVEEERESILAEQKDRFEDEYYRLEYRGADEETLRATRERYEQERQETAGAWDSFLLTLWDTQIGNGGQRENFEALGAYAEQYLAGERGADEINSLLGRDMGYSLYAGTGWDTSSDRAQLGRMLGMAVLSFGGQDDITARIAEYRKSGNTEMAERLTRLLAAEQLINNFGTPHAIERPWYDFISPEGAYDFNNSYSFRESGFDPIKQENRNKFESAIAEAFGFDEATAFMLDYAKRGAAAFEGMETAQANLIRNQLQAIGGSGGRGAEGPFANNPAIRAALDAIDASGAGAVTGLIIDLNTKIQEAEINGLQRLGDTPRIAREIERAYGGVSERMDEFRERFGEFGFGPDGKPLEAEITLGVNDAAFAAWLAQNDGRTITISPTIDWGGLPRSGGLPVWVAGGRQIGGGGGGGTNTMELYGEGGRATKPSIFGDAGTEWAIPETHSDRTAELLNAARAASGFTWGDLITRFGGLNANPQNKQTTIVYSPTIHAEDASGVERALREDKRRLEKWLEEKELRDAVEVYS